MAKPIPTKQELDRHRRIAEELFRDWPCIRYLADVIKVNPNTVYAWKHRGRIPLKWIKVMRREADKKHARARQVFGK